jgi:hypothetical protein
MTNRAPAAKVCGPLAAAFDASTDAHKASTVRTTSLSDVFIAFQAAHRLGIGQRNHAVKRSREYPDADARAPEPAQTPQTGVRHVSIRHLIEGCQSWISVAPRCADFRIGLSSWRNLGIRRFSQVRVAGDAI